MIVSVAIPVLNGGPRLGEVLAALAGQQLGTGVELELVVCDSGSVDGSPQRCLAAGARLESIERSAFSHGGTRNELMALARGELVAFLTQDAVPASAQWLARLIAPFAQDPRVALAYGPYEPRPDASPTIARELRAWFGSLASDDEVDGDDQIGPHGQVQPDARVRPDGRVRWLNGRVRVDELSAAELGRLPGVPALTPRELYGPRPYFTDANGCVRRSAWERVPFRPIGYAEDHALALDMLASGFAKAFVPDAAVIHSHDYTPREWLARSFDEARAVREVYGFVEPVGVRSLVRRVGPLVRADVRTSGVAALPRSLAHHGARWLGTTLGGRAERVPLGLARALSLEGRAN